VLDSVDSEELPAIVMDLLAELEQDTQDLFHSSRKRYLYFILILHNVNGKL